MIPETDHMIEMIAIMIETIAIMIGTGRQLAPDKKLFSGDDNV